MLDFVFIRYRRGLIGSVNRSAVDMCSRFAKCSADTNTSSGMNMAVFMKIWYKCSYTVAKNFLSLKQINSNRIRQINSLDKNQVCYILICLA